MLLIESRKSEERMGLGIIEESGLGLVQVKYQQKSHMKVLNRKLVGGIRAGKRDYFCRASLEVIFKEVRLGAVKVDEFAIERDGQGKR